jgi:hypothetical protein
MSHGNQNQGNWYIPAIAHKLADGSTLIKPGKAVCRGTASQVSKWTGVHRKVLSKLADCGLISRLHPSPGLTWYYPSEVETLIQKTQSEPDFWNTVKRKAFITGTSLRSAITTEQQPPTPPTP